MEVKSLTAAALCPKGVSSSWSSCHGGSVYSGGREGVLGLLFMTSELLLGATPGMWRFEDGDYLKCPWIRVVSVFLARKSDITEI